MHDNKDLSYFMDLNYEIILKKKDNLYCLIVPQLSLVVTDENLESGYERLKEEKEAFFKKIIELDATGKIIEPRDEKELKKLIPGISDLVSLCIKSMTVSSSIAIVLLIMSILIVPMLKPLSKSFNYTLSQSITTAVSSFKNIPAEAMESSFNLMKMKVGNLYQHKIFRLRMLGFITTNPVVHYKASIAKEELNNIEGAIEEIELALGLLSMNASDSETVQKYKKRLSELKKKAP